jgi:thiol-disulfide isomerase/thioredoxin
MPNRCSRCGRGRSHSWLVPAIALAFALCPQPALAEQDSLSTAETLALADYYAEYQGRRSEGRALVVELLEANPENLQAQRWYIHSWQWFSEISRVEVQYRAWLEAKPDDELRRLLLALTFAADRGRSSRFSSEDCVELAGLLEPLPKDPERRFLALSTLNHAYGFNDCEGDVKKTREEMLGLLDRSAYARQYYLRQPEGGIRDAQWLALLQRSYQDDPTDLIDALQLWNDSEMHATTALQEGGEAPQEKSAEALGEEALGEARKHALKAARKALRSKRLSQINVAHRVFQTAGEDKAAARAVKFLLRLDPAWQDRSRLDDDRKAQRKMRQKLRGAKRKFDAAQRLEALDALSEEAPNNDKARGILLQARGQALADLGRTEEAVEEYRKAHEAMPDSHHMANSFAWEAALAGVQLDKALVAVEQALRLARAETWRRAENMRWEKDLEEWSRGRRRTEGAYLDTRAWILYKLDRYKEAEVAERAALRLHQSSELQRHMGLIYARLGDRHAAISHLAEGIRVDKTALDPLSLEALEVFKELFEEAGYWHQDGPDGYLALVAQERKRKAEERKSRKTGGEGGSTDDDRFVPGTQFPDLAYRTGDEEHKLSELKQTVVLDVWATWCRPCVEGLPHLNEIARQYKERGVTTLALSVDDKPEDAEGFFAPSDKIEFLRGWAGDKAMDTIGIKRIPAIFILDKDLKILGHFFGYADGDRRIEDLLDEVMEDND